MKLFLSYLIIRLFFSILKPIKHSSWWRPLEDVSKRSFIFVFRRRLQDFKNQYKFLPWTYVFKTSSRSFQDVFKTSSKLLQDVLQKCLQGNLNTFSRRLQYVFRIYHEIKPFLLTLLQNVFKTFQEVFNAFLRRTAKKIIYRKICLGYTSEKFMVRVQISKEWTLCIYRKFYNNFLVKDILVKVGYQKRCCCLSKKRINE